MSELVVSASSKAMPARRRKAVISSLEGQHRFAGAHRMGQTNPVEVYWLETEWTIEEKLLARLSAKHDLALAALDMESSVREVALAAGSEELKKRLEVLLGARAHAAVDET